MKILKFLWFFVLVFGFSQNQGFNLRNGVKKEVIPFQLINNLIFIPVSINGVELTFLLDTGVSETLLFSLENKEVNFNSVEKMTFSGLGENINIEGLKSENNAINVGKNFADAKHTVFIILDEDFNFSSYVGIPVHGIIGYHFFKNQPVHIDYISKKITIYKKGADLGRKKRGYVELPIEMEYNKPYLTGNIQMNSDVKPAKMLIDLGNSDALWIFPTLIKDFVYNRPNIDDFLGRGFNGDIYGKRSRIKSFSLGEFTFIKPLTAMPDEYSIQNVNLAKGRKGSVGSEIMRRFQLIINYPENKIYFKKNKNFNNPFLFNMSGLDFKHDGVIWESEYVKMETTPSNKSKDGAETAKTNIFQYKLIMKPVFAVAGVRKDSPASVAGLQKGDVLVMVNGKKASGMTLDELNSLMQHGEGKTIDFRITRKGVTMEFSLTLEDPIPYQEN